MASDTQRLDEPSAGGSRAPSAEAVSELLMRWSEGDRAALDVLMPIVYDELRRMAEHHLRQEHPHHTMPRTGLVHEAYLRLARQQALDVRCRAQFFGLASSVMRHVLVDHARARRAAKRGGGADHVSLSDVTSPSGKVATHAEADLAALGGSLDLLALDASLRQLEQLDARQARVVEMRFFVGLSVEETAEAMQLSPATVKREWSTARAWLLRDLKHGGRTDGGAPRPAARPPAAA